MGSYFSSGVEIAKDEIRSTVLRNLALQYEVQKAINIAKARDQLMWMSAFYGLMCSGIFAGVALKKPVPHFAAVPVVIGGFVIANMADAAYGNKLIRVRKEAELILGGETRESAIMVPPSQALFFETYPESETAASRDVMAVGHLWPSFLPWSRKTTDGAASKRT